MWRHPLALISALSWGYPWYQGSIRRGDGGGGGAGGAGRAGGRGGGGSRTQILCTKNGPIEFSLFSVLSHDHFGLEGGGSRGGGGNPAPPAVYGHSNTSLPGTPVLCRGAAAPSAAALALCWTVHDVAATGRVQHSVRGGEDVMQESVVGVRTARRGHGCWSSFGRFGFKFGFNFWMFKTSEKTVL